MVHPVWRVSIEFPLMGRTPCMQSAACDILGIPWIALPIGTLAKWWRWLWLYSYCRGSTYTSCHGDRGFMPASKGYAGGGAFPPNIQHHLLYSLALGACYGRGVLWGEQSSAFWDLPCWLLPKSLWWPRVSGASANSFRWIVFLHVCMYMAHVPCTYEGQQAALLLYVCGPSD